MAIKPTTKALLSQRSKIKRSDTKNRSFLAGGSRSKARIRKRVLAGIRQSEKAAVDKRTKARVKLSRSLR